MFLNQDTQICCFAFILHTILHAVFTTNTATSSQAELSRHFFPHSTTAEWTAERNKTNLQTQHETTKRTLAPVFQVVESQWENRKGMKRELAKGPAKRQQQFMAALCLFQPMVKAQRRSWRKRRPSNGTAGHLPSS